MISKNNLSRAAICCLVVALTLVAVWWISEKIHEPTKKQDAKTLLRQQKVEHDENPNIPPVEAAESVQSVRELDEMAIASLRESLENVRDLARRIERNSSADTEELTKAIEEWELKMHRTISTRTREDLFALIQISAEYFSKTRRMGVHGELRIIRDWMEHVGPWIIRELGKVVEERSGNLDSLSAERAIRVFSVRGFDNEPDWEDQYKPLDGAGVLIACDSIASVCEKLTLPELEFLIWTNDAERYFRRYKSDGDGLKVLKERYEVDRERILREFSQIHELLLRKKAEKTE